MQVHSTPSVAVLSTGDEVVEPTTVKLAAGQIRDANRAMLVAASQQAGAKVVDLGIARDTEGHVKACLQKAINAQVDVLLTTGVCGNSMWPASCCGHANNNAQQCPGCSKSLASQ